MKNIGLVLLVSFVISGCATAFNDKTQDITLVTSNGKPTEVTINGVKYQAPGVISVPRSRKSTVIVANSSTCKGETPLSSFIDDSFVVANLLFPPWGHAIDYYNSSEDKMWRYSSGIKVKCN